MAAVLKSVVAPVLSTACGVEVPGDARGVAVAGNYAYVAAGWWGGLQVIDMRKPLAAASEPYAWVSETTVAPWVIYVLGKSLR